MAGKCSSDRSGEMNWRGASCKFHNLHADADRPPALLPAGMALTSIGDLGWNALRDWSIRYSRVHHEQLAHNLTTMADYCRRRRVELAPHTKTSLAPQLVRRQMEARALGATAATAAQVRGLLAIGVARILLANLLVDPVAIRWIVTHVLTKARHRLGGVSSGGRTGARSVDAVSPWRRRSTIKVPAPCRRGWL